jgi:hypothetical protein
MKTREAMIEVMREHWRGIELKKLEISLRLMPLQVVPGSAEFPDLGPWFQAQIIAKDISVAYELHQLVLERQQTEMQGKGAKAPGEHSNVK